MSPLLITLMANTIINKSGARTAWIWNLVGADLMQQSFFLIKIYSQYNSLSCLYFFSSLAMVHIRTRRSTQLVWKWWQCTGRGRRKTSSLAVVSLHTWLYYWFRTPLADLVQGGYRHRWLWAPAGFWWMEILAWACHRPQQAWLMASDPQLPARLFFSSLFRNRLTFRL